MAPGPALRLNWIMAVPPAVLPYIMLSEILFLDVWLQTLNFYVCDSALRILSYFALTSQGAAQGAGSVPRRMMTEGRMG